MTASSLTIAHSRSQRTALHDSTLTDSGVIKTALIYGLIYG